MTEVIKNSITTGFAVSLIVFCLFPRCAVTANARQSSNAAELIANNVGIKAHLTSKSRRFDDFNDSPCARFPKEERFDSFEKALQTPEKVKCLDPNFEGDDLNMQHLPSGLSALVNLEVLSFGCLEQLKDLPAEIGALSKLEELVIDNGNGCSMNISLPSSIGKLKNLRVLKLYGAIESPNLPETIANLHKLEMLDIARNGLQAVPPQIAALPNLKTLRLEYNDLRQIPDFVSNFKNLKELSLNSNGRNVVLPRSLAKLKGLKVSMGNNSLKL